MKEDMLKVENYYNKVFKYKQIKIYNIDNSLKYGVDYIEFHAKIITDMVIVIPNFVISAILDIENKDMSFSIAKDEVKNILNN